MRFSKLVPMPHTQDMERTSAWYVDILVFELKKRVGGRRLAEVYAE